ncbi:hypothetical protein D3C73_1469280 [compost metagenome]
MNAAFIAIILLAHDQPFGFQKLKRLGYRTFGETEVIRHAERRIGIAVAARQIH